MWQVYFDMIDLPGLQSDGTKVTHELVEKYINGDTLHKTFVLIFADPGGGDTRLLRSLCVSHIQRVQQVTVKAFKRLLIDSEKP